MADNLLRLRCSVALDALPVPRPFSLAPLCRNLERHCRHHVRLVAASMPPGCEGLWIRTAQTDYICYQRHARYPRALQIIGHQAAHVMFGHQGTAAGDRGLARLLFPHLDPQMVQQTLALSAFTDAEELEADLFASLLLKRIDGPLERPSPTPRQ